jgi:hypothetical protein
MLCRPYTRELKAVESREDEVVKNVGRAEFDMTKVG